MTNRKLLTRGVVFSYATLLVQVSYSFVSIPLALAHLSTAEFGLWGLVSTIGSFLLMAELGMTEAFMRHLFECKDGTEPERYGRLFTASFLALGIVSLIILVLGSLIALFAAPLLNIPLNLHRDFMWVMLGSAFMGALSTGSRMFGVPLVLHHRQDLSQFAQLILFILRFCVLYFSFQAGWGIYSLLAVEVIGVFWLLPFFFVVCRRFGYYPSLKHLGLPSREEWSEVRNYSLSAFAIQIGGILLAGLPHLLISAFAGLHAAGLWTVCTRVFNILKDIAFRPFGIASPMLMDFYVKGDVTRAVGRWTQVTQVVTAAAGFLFAVAAANNRIFVQLWTGIGAEWELPMQLAIACYFLAFVVAGCPYAVIGFSKSFGIARVVPILQALLVTFACWLITSRTGSGGVALVSAAGFVLGMFVFGTRQLAQVTGTRVSELITQSVLRPVLAAPLVFLAAWGCSMLASPIPGFPGLLLSGALGSALGLPIMGYIGVASDARAELFSMILKPIRRFLPGKLKTAAS